MCNTSRTWVVDLGERGVGAQLQGDAPIGRRQQFDAGKGGARAHRLRIRYRPAHHYKDVVLPRGEKSLIDLAICQGRPRQSPRSG